MTMVRNITSHSQRAVLVETGELSNRLASEASRAAYLMNIFVQAPEETADSVKALPRLVANAKRFASEYSVTVEMLPNRASQNYLNLISLDLFEQALELKDSTVEENAELARRLSAAIDAASNGSGKLGEFQALANDLDSVSMRLAAHSRRMTVATIGA